MKKLFNVLLVVLMLFVVAACDPESGESTGNDVTFDVDIIKAFSADEKYIFVLDDGIDWKYTAEKLDDGYTTGAAEKETELKSDKLTLSLGYWKIALYGYSGESLIWSGKIDEVTLLDSDTDIKITLTSGVEEGNKLIETVDAAFTAIEDSSSKNVTLYVLKDEVKLGKSIMTLLGVDDTSAYTLTFVGKGKDKSSIYINTGKEEQGEEAAKPGANYVEGAKLNFKDITVIIGDNSDYRGVVRSGDLTFTDCSIVGRGSYWGDGKVTFTRCVFEDWDKNTETSKLGDSYAYNLWLYTGKEYYFDGCTFNSSCGRFINAYLEKGTDATTSVKVTIKDSTFNGREGYTKKAALILKNNTVWNVTLENITTNNVKTSDAKHGNSSWYEIDDEGTCQPGTTVTIDGTVVWQNGSKVSN